MAVPPPFRGKEAPTKLPDTPLPQQQVTEAFSKVNRLYGSFLWVVLMGNGTRKEAAKTVGLDQTVPQGKGHCLEPAMGPQLGQEVVNVVSDCGGADGELLGDGLG